MLCSAKRNSSQQPNQTRFNQNQTLGFGWSKRGKMVHFWLSGVWSLEKWLPSEVENATCHIRWGEGSGGRDPAKLFRSYLQCGCLMQTPGREEPHKYHPDNKSCYVVFTCRQELGIISEGSMIVMQFTARATALKWTAPCWPFTSGVPWRSGSTHGHWFLLRDDFQMCACVIVQVGVNVQLIQVITVRRGAVTTQIAKWNGSPRTRVRKHVRRSHVHQTHLSDSFHVESLSSAGKWESHRPCYVFNNIFSAGFS